MNRRNFLQLSGASATMLTSTELFAATNKHEGEITTGYELKVLATNWGYQGSLDQYLSSVKHEGYNGIEIWWPMEKKAQDELFELLKKYSLEVGFLCGGSQPDFNEHLKLFKSMTNAAADNSFQRPLYINCHSGRDYFSETQNQAFIDHTAELSRKTGVLICHETHRSRILYSAPIARNYLEKNPSLKITFDVSHWCNVHESLLQDQAETLSLALSRTEHIHARIGHPEGPQVNDPRAPEWQDAVKAHLSWWDKVIERKKKAGERMTILTEFGPPDYMPTVPYTRQPLADQWAINVHMMQLLKKRYGGDV